MPIWWSFAYWTQWRNTDNSHYCFRMMVTVTVLWSKYCHFMWYRPCSPLVLVQYWPIVGWPASGRRQTSITCLLQTFLILSSRIRTFLQLSPICAENAENPKLLMMDNVVYLELFMLVALPTAAAAVMFVKHYQGRKISPYFINIWDIATKVVPFCSVHQAPSDEPNFTLLTWFLPMLACYLVQASSRINNIHR